MSRQFQQFPRKLHFQNSQPYAGFKDQYRGKQVEETKGEVDPKDARVKALQRMGGKLI